MDSRFGLEERLRGVVGSVLDPPADASDLAVTEVRVNGRRVDVRLRAGAGRRFLAVIWFADESLDGVQSVKLYPRPESFQGTPGGLVVVLHGPSSVGKSRLMRAFAERARTPFCYFDEPFLGRPPANFLAWPETLGPHVDGVLAAIAAAAALGNQFVLSAAGISQDRFRAAFASVVSIYVGLAAPLDVLVERQLLQPDKFGGLAEDSINIHEGWDYDFRIDTVRHRPDAAAELLSEFIAKRFHRSP